ncbi:uncharacterized protein LOC127706656 [Mytilus californianus]|uniref:uncharacterized protein LOC127706656 n=1 Tax=Mytilus californianus TaxID=6549 RepID=UPI0022466D66|nr:uncharacterized protein LOC127706656 [Mytilus californianus]
MKKKPERGLKALATGSLAIARFHSILDKTEKRLELEIQRENRAPPQTLVGKARRKGEHVLHSKQVLFCIIILNVIDCILVLGELILDMYYVKGLLESSESVTNNFIIDMKTIYPTELSVIEIPDVEPLYSKLLHAHIEWSHSETNKLPSVVFNCSPELTTTSHQGTSHHVIENSTPHTIEKRSANVHTDTQINGTDNENGNSTKEDHHDDHQGDHAHSFEEDLAHAFHKASISILAILAAETICKIFAYGLRFFERKLEVFDCVIVFGSLFVDVYFLKGISAYKIQDFVIILAFLVPWRVIRVVNSLVVAVIDHEHFRLKLLYKQKKEVSHDLKKTKSEVKNLQQSMDIVRRLANEAGVTEQKISQHLAFLNQNLGKSKKKGLGFGHSFPLFHHHQHSPKSSHSTSDLKLHLEAKRNGILKEEGEVTEHVNIISNGNITLDTINSQVNAGYVEERDDGGSSHDSDVVIHVPNGDASHHL